MIKKVNPTTCTKSEKKMLELLEKEIRNGSLESTDYERTAWIKRRVLRWMLNRNNYRTIADREMLIYAIWTCIDSAYNEGVNSADWESEVDE